MSASVEPVFFPSTTALRAWFMAHGASSTVLWVGFHKVQAGKEVMTWPESVDAALCFGWIDGVRKRIDERRYMIRFSPRRRNGIWSAVNLKRMQELIEAQLVQPSGVRAFEARRENRSGIYSYEQRPLVLSGKYARELRRHPPAAAFFEAQPPSYRKAAVWWVLSAKQELTRSRRLQQLIRDSAKSRRLKQFVSPSGTKKKTSTANRRIRALG